MIVITDSISDPSGSFTLNGLDYPKGVYYVIEEFQEDTSGGSNRQTVFYGIKKLGTGSEGETLVWPTLESNFTVNGVTGVTGLVDLLDEVVGGSAGTGPSYVSTVAGLSGISSPTNGLRAVVDGGVDDEVFIYDSAQSAVNNGITIFDGWVRRFDGKYLKPQWFGAAMDGTTDDRAAFVTTIAHAETLGLDVCIDRDMYLDVLEEATKSIFLPDNINIIGVNNPKVTVLNNYSPFFHLALADNIKIAGFTIEWVGTYDVLNYQNPSSTANQDRLKDYMVANKGVTFTAGNPLFSGGSAFRALFLIDGSTNITIKDMKIKAVDNAGAHQFIPWVAKVKSQFSKNTTVTDENTAVRTSASNILFENVEIDGALMGIQGDAQGITIRNITGGRYTDAQDASGNYVGGNSGDNTYSVAPPHLIYLIPNHLDDPVTGVRIYNVIDKGEYVGTPNVRATSSGFCTSLVLNADVSDVVVDGYRSFRRDGLAGIVNITDAVFKNMYSESYNSELFGAINDDFSAFRQNGTLTNVVFENIIVKDLSASGVIPPVTTQFGDNVTVNNVHLFSKDLTNLTRNCLSYFGSNNRITNSGLTMEDFDTTSTFKSVINNNSDTRDNGANNYIDIYVKGWRDLTSDERGTMIRVDLLVSSSNTNPNYYKISDVDNNYFIENTNGVPRVVWTVSEVITVGTGFNSIFSIQSYDDWNVNTITAQVISDLGSGSFSLGTGGSAQDFWIPSLDGTAGEIVVQEINQVVPEDSNRSIFVFSDAAMNGTGQIKVTLELERSMNESTNIAEVGKNQILSKLQVIDNGIEQVNSAGSVGSRDSYGGGIDRNFMGANINFRHWSGPDFSGASQNVLRLSNTQNFSYTPFVFQPYNNSQRDALTGLSDGATIYNSQINEINYLDGSTWFKVKRVGEVIAFNASRNITETDIQNSLYSTTSATLTITTSFNNMENGHEVELIANGTTITITGASGVTVNGVSAGSVTVGNDSATVGGTLKKVGTNEYVVL